MFLKELQLKTSDSLKSLKLSFHNQLTVIIGKNGLGKSNVLGAAIIALSAYTSGFNGYKILKMSPSDPRMKVFPAGCVIDVKPQVPVEISATAKIADKEISWSRTMKTKTDKQVSYKEY